MRWLRRIGWVLATVVASLLTLWAASAIYFDSPLGGLRAVAAVAYLIVVLVVMALLRRRGVGMLVPFVGFALVAVWWFSLKPSNDRDWQPDNAQTAYADINGDQVTIHNFRNCDYRTEQDYTCHWETRSYNLANLSRRRHLHHVVGIAVDRASHRQLRFRRPGPRRHVD